MLFAKLFCGYCHSVSAQLSQIKQSNNGVSQGQVINLAPFPAQSRSLSFVSQCSFRQTLINCGAVELAGRLVQYSMVDGALTTDQTHEHITVLSAVCSEWINHILTTVLGPICQPQAHPILAALGGKVSSFFRLALFLFLLWAKVKTDFAVPKAYSPPFIPTS